MGKVFFVEENLNEFAKRGRPRKAAQEDPEMEDNWYSADDEFDGNPKGPTAADIENVEIEDEVTDLAVQKKLTKMLDNELKMGEVSRGVLNFRIRTTGEDVAGIPLAKMPSGDAYLFKTTKGGMKKVKVADMMVENYQGPQLFVAESIKNYE